MFAISVRFVLKLESVADCHLVTVPVRQINVSKMLFVHEHTVASPLMLPPTEAKSTVIVAVALFEEEQEPLETIAL